MNRKILTRLLSVLLVVVMTFGLLPVSASAAWWNNTAETQPAETADRPVVDTQAATDDGFYRILHLDCGRKYFSKDWIIALLYEMKDAGYNQLQLAFGNDGLRFLLDDMSFTANGTTYSNETVVTKVKAGNKAQNSSGDESYLTETEMTEIITKANSLGIEIVPLLNLPGHANAILDIADDAYNASGSNNTLNVVSTSDTARNFGMAIFKKYVDYFYGKGCKFFSFGADEYANDAGKPFSFSRLSSTEYGRFVTFINSLAEYIEGKGMTPRAFNDGLYYNGQTNAADTNIQCCYWSSGWGDYPVASATTIANNGHAMINTNGDFYYVLGKSDKFDSDYSYASNFSNTAFMSSNISKPVGSMFCIWCDFPNAETETVVAQKTRLVLRAMAARMQDKRINTINKDVVTNGFNADGTLNGASTEPGGDTDVKNTVNVTLEVGQTSQTYTQDGDVTSKVTKDDNFDEVASAKIEHKQQTTEGKEEAVTSVSSGDTYYIKNSSGKYLDSSANWVDNISSAAQWTWDGNYLKNGSNYLRYYRSKWQTTTSSSNATTLYFNDGTFYRSRYLLISTYQYYNEFASPVKYTAGEKVDKTEITFTGKKVGTTSIKIGDTRYYITVEYKEQTVNVTVDNTATVTVSGTLDKTDLNENFATVAVSGTKMTVTGIATGDTYVIVGDTKYNIHVTEEDIEGADKAKLEFWITNAPITSVEDTKTEIRTTLKNEEYTVYYKELSATYPKMNTEDGVAIDGFAPDSTAHGKRTIYYWHSRILDTTETNDYGNNLGSQTKDGGDDETSSGSAFTKIRYYNHTWSVYTANGWVNIEAKHQLVAYYAEYLKITDEVGSYGADWGNKGDGTATGDWLDVSNYCTLSIQVVYEDGTTNPSDTTAAALTAKSLVYGYWPQGRGIGTVILKGNDQYEIYKVTAETGESKTSINSSTYAATITNLTWDDNELTVWEDGNGSDEAVIHNPSNGFSKEGVNANLCWDENKEAILLRVYIRAKVTEDSLTVHYIDKTDANKETEFYKYNIAVKSGTLFDPNFAYVAGGSLTGNTVKNFHDVTQTVQWDLSQMKEIDTAYRYVQYDFVNATRSTNGKEVYLYYTFRNPEAEFVIDFGLPLEIKETDVFPDLTAANKVTASKPSYGTVKISGTTATYTPNKVLLEDDSFYLTYEGYNSTTGTTGNIAYKIVIHPASNVLYEENFLKTADSSWKMTDAEITDAQQLQKANDGKTYNVFGYDGAYAGSDNENGVWKATGLTTTAATGDLTADFYGNGFDLIGNCGPTTGQVMMIIAKQGTKKGVAGVIIDTRYKDTIYQVPLAHVMLREEGAYTAVIRATGLKSETVSTQAAVYAAPSAVRANNAVADMLAEYGLSSADVEYIGGDQIAASPIAVRRAPAVATYASIEHGAGDHVEIAGFRVYRDTTGTVAANYPTAEQNLTYTNIIDLLGSKIITATVEGGNVVSCTPTEYEKNGGPQNEVYLAQNQAISFGVSTGDPIQVSLRAVSGTSDWNGTKISSITELYYEVEPELVGGQYTVTIMNKQSDGLLAIGNVKVPNSVTVQTTSELSDDVILASVRAVYAAAPEPVEPELFTPDTFKVHVTSLPMFRSKIVTLGITVSKDVAYVTVNGRTYTPSQFFSRWLKTVTIPVTETISRSETRTYTIIAYNSDGTASEPIVVKG